jgi:hypothetical protein
MELICGEQYTMERAETATRTGWTTDPVHPSDTRLPRLAYVSLRRWPTISQWAAVKVARTRRPSARTTGEREREGGMTAVKKKGCPTGPPEARAGRKEAAAVADSGAAVPVAAAGVMEAEEAATATKGVAAMVSMESKIQPIMYSRQRGDYFNPGYPSRGPKGGGGGHHGRQNRGGYDRWGNPY